MTELLLDKQAATAKKKPSQVGGHVDVVLLKDIESIEAGIWIVHANGV